MQNIAHKWSFDECDEKPTGSLFPTGRNKATITNEDNNGEIPLVLLLASQSAVFVPAVYLIQWYSLINKLKASQLTPSCLLTFVKEQNIKF